METAMKTKRRGGWRLRLRPGWQPANASPAGSAAKQRLKARCRPCSWLTAKLRDCLAQHVQLMGEEAGNGAVASYLDGTCVKFNV